MKEVFGKKPVTSRDFPVILFDAGGTLLHPNPSFVKTYQAWLAEFGIAKSDVEMDAAVIKVLKHFNHESEADEDFELKPNLWLPAILEALALQNSEQIKAQAREEFISSLASTIKMAVPQSTIDICAQLKDRGYRLGLVSNWSGVLSDFIRDQGILDLFETIITSLDIGFAKPRREIFEAALEDLDVDATRAVMIGDSFAADMVGASRVGLQKILYDPKLRELRALSHEDTSSKVVAIDSLKHNRRLVDIRVITRFDELLEIFL